MFDRPLDPALEPFARSVLDGLSRRPKRLEPKWFYDAEGSRLFEAITRLPEYYPTRAETAILTEAAEEIAARIGPGAALWEPGAGSLAKARLLLDALRPDVFAPMDISAEHLDGAAEALRAERPGLTVAPVAADFAEPFAPPPEARAARTLVAFFPGSTIGNLDPEAARALLARFRREAGADWLLIGVDLVKDEARLVAAYDDAQGVTAAFNLNLLARINRELEGTFDLDGFTHVARFDREASRVEMLLESRRAQQPQALGRRFRFAAGERMLTERSYKYRPDAFAALAAEAGWSRRGLWTGREALFAVFLFEAEQRVGRRD
jgi:dimethylhistidine N-methyltransferase